MAFEGYYDVLCARGHLRGWDCYDSLDCKNWRCECGAKMIWYTCVDCTNGEDENGLFPGEVKFEIDIPAVTKECNLGCHHTIKEATYKIPLEGGHKIH